VRRPEDREILRLAVPALLTLAAEPLFLLADAVIIGRLGTTELAGLGIAAVVLQTAVGVCVFLAYGTTASVARSLGAGDVRRAAALGVDGLWLALGVGATLSAAVVLLTGPLVGAFGASAGVEGQAAAYLRIAALGIAPLLLMLAATGVLRGLQDTRTPLVVAVAGNVLNVVLNLVLVYPAGLGIQGAALGSVIAQTVMAMALVQVVIRGARRQHASLSPDRRGVAAAARGGVPLVIRTLTLRAALVVTTYAVVAGSAGREAEIAAHQLAFTIWGFLALVLDAIAIAAQALTGRYLGAGDATAVRTVTRRMIRWGWGTGLVTGICIAVSAPVLPAVFTTDSAVGDLLVPVLLVVAVSQPLCGVVFVLDGVLIGAGDGRYLAWAGLVVLAAYAPAVLLVGRGEAGLLVIWVLFSALFMGARAVLLLGRSRGDAWLVLGGTRPRLAP
jgi:putative MATE family efflux protein